MCNNNNNIPFLPPSLSSKMLPASNLVVTEKNLSIQREPIKMFCFQVKISFSRRVAVVSTSVLVMASRNKSASVGRACNLELVLSGWLMPKCCFFLSWSILRTFKKHRLPFPYQSLQHFPEVGEAFPSKWLLRSLLVYTMQSLSAGLTTSLQAVLRDKGP